MWLDCESERVDGEEKGKREEKISGRRGGWRPFMYL